MKIKVNNQWKNCNKILNVMYFKCLNCDCCSWAQLARWDANAAAAAGDA